MAVPTPNIKPLLIEGGTHTARYVGAIGVASGAQRTEASFFVYPNEDGTHPDLAVGASVLVGDDDYNRFYIRETQFLGTTGKGDMRVVLEAEDVNARYVFPIGTPVYLEASPIDPDLYPGELTIALSASSSAAAQLIIDLTAFSARLREDDYFRDHLTVTIQALDDGIVDVTPYVLGPQEFHGSPAAEYLQLSAVNNSTANQCVVTVELGHTTTR